jgi:hypothetical protein
VPPLLDELGLSATIHSAKNATVPTSSAISGRPGVPINLIIGTCPRRVEPSRAY